MPSYITERSRTEQSIADRMEQNIGIGMPEEPCFMRYLHPAEKELSPLGEPVNIISVTYAEIHLLSLPFSTPSTSRISAGVVILILSEPVSIQ